MACSKAKKKIFRISGIYIEEEFYWKKTFLKRLQRIFWFIKAGEVKEGDWKAEEKSWKGLKEKDQTLNVKSAESWKINEEEGWVIEKES